MLDLINSYTVPHFNLILTPECVAMFLLVAIPSAIYALAAWADRRPTNIISKKS